MTIFEAYIITTLLPNISSTASVIAWLSVISALVGGYITYIALDATEDEAGRFRKFFKYAFVTFLISCLLTCIFPDRKQMAAIVALKIGTSQEAQAIYGEAGDFLKTWLKEQTKEMVKEDDKK